MIKRGIPYCHPGQLFRDELINEQGLTVTKIAELLGVSRITVSNIVNEKSAISPEMAVRIATVFGGTADIWMRLQTGYDLEKAKKKITQLKLMPFSLVKTDKPPQPAIEEWMEKTAGAHNTSKNNIITEQFKGIKRKRKIS